MRATPLPLLVLLGCSDTQEETDAKGPDVRDSAIDAPDDTAPDTTDPSRVDDDGDGWSEFEGDCDDTDAAVNPGTVETCGDRVDDDCDDTLDNGSLVTADAATFSSGAFGYSYLGLEMERTICTISGALEQEGPAPPGCPDCVWSFDLSPVRASIAIGGRGCAALGVMGGALDGEFDYAWGFAPSYAYDYGGREFEARNVVFLYFDDVGQWYPFAFDEPAYGVDRVSGDARSLRFEFPAAGGLEYYSYVQP